MKGFKIALLTSLAFCSASVFAAEPQLTAEEQVKVQAVDDAQFEGRVIGLIACNNNQNVVITMHNEQTDAMKSFITDAAPQGILNPVLAKAYVSVGKKDKPALTITYNPNYTGETCGNPNIEGYWTGYAK